MDKPKIAFCGMTHLGINSAVASAARGFHVTCFDPDKKLINELSKGIFPIVEPQLEDLSEKNKQNLLYTYDLSDLTNCDIIYIAPDVPTDASGVSDLSNINSLLKLVEPELKDSAILVILSQVPPGFTRQYANLDKLVFYQVETLIFGKAIERAYSPERFIIGCKSPSEDLPEIYKSYLSSFECPLLTMRYESAELAKISINMCLVASVSVANTLAEICENIGADWNEIIPSLRLDKRIGQYSYIQAGLGISGGNLERDLATVVKLSEKNNTDGGVVNAWIANSNHRKNWPYQTLKKQVLDSNPEAKIAVLGLAYKENTNSTKNSPALLLLDNLIELVVTVYDPVATIEANEKIRVVTSMYDAIDGADAVVIITPWPEFKDISISRLVDLMKGDTVIDPYRMLSGEELKKARIRHIVIGAN